MFIATKHGYNFLTVATRAIELDILGKASKSLVMLPEVCLKYALRLDWKLK